MKSTTHLLLLTCFLWCGNQARGAAVDSKSAANAVKGWLQVDRKPLGAALGSQIKGVDTYKDKGGAPLYHVVNLEPSGFVIVSGEDETEPIIAFVQQGQFDPSPSNPLGALVSRDLPSRVAYARAHAGASAGLKNRGQWQKLQASAVGGTSASAIGAISDVRVAPFIQTCWDQGSLPTTITNWIVVNNQLVVNTHIDAQAQGNTAVATVEYTNLNNVMRFMNGAQPITHSFGGTSATVDIVNGPGPTMTNYITVLDHIELIVTNEFGEIIADRTWTASTVVSNVVSGSAGSTVTTVIPVSIGTIVVVSDSKACYNYFTPPHEPRNKQNYVCGCVATAMAQLMYYHQYPQTGVGTKCFQITVDGTPMGRNLRGGNGAGGPYNWNTMPLWPDYWSLTQPQAQAVGALLCDAALSVNMAFTKTESGSTMEAAQASLVSTFQYGNAVVNAVTNLDTGCFECALFKMMNPNLDARLPVLLGITGDPGGHAIVCDGYGFYFGSPYHHLNMGWSGAYNAWYALPIIDMQQPDGSYIYFWDVLTCLYNVYTSGSGEIISGRVLDLNGLPMANAGITAIGSSGTIHTAVTDGNGIYALPRVPSASTYTITVTNGGYYPVTSNYTTGTSLNGGTGSGNIWGADFTLVPAKGPPVIATQPHDQTVTVGTNATFTVSAGGALPLVYQWQYQPRGSLTWIDVTDGGNYSGAQTPTLVVSQTDTNMDGEPFQCVVSNSVSTVTSAQAILYVTVAPFLQIATIAGTVGTNGSTDGTNALFYNPHGIAVDSNTNVYVADMYNHVIRKLTPAGTGWAVTTIAGLAGNSGSADGANQDARFSSPYGVAVDGAGTVYVADTANCTIRRITLSGTNWVVTTISGLAGSPGSSGGSGTTARYRYPTGLAVDGSGNIYIADEGNSVIRKLALAGQNWMSTTIAGTAGSFGSTDGMNASARFGEPYGVAVLNGIVYVVDKYNNTIRKVAPSGANWVVTTIAGLTGTTGISDGIGTGARFSSPTGIATGIDGNLYVADQGNNTIRRLSPAGDYWMAFTVAGLAGASGSADGIGSAARFNAPFGVAVDVNTNLYVSDSLNSTIRMTPAPVAPPPLTLKATKQLLGGTMTLVWGANAGHAYRVQYKTSLSSSTWTDYSSVTPSTWTGVAAVPMKPDARRFYRVIPVQ